MLNWFGNHKIGILGSANSGKTILLTSLLWHLSNHNTKRFKLNNNAQICDFKLTKSDNHDFNFALHKNTFIQKHCWPSKTVDFSTASCRFSRKDCLCERHLEFVDIPGERVSDILLWQSSSYAEWVERIREFWSENPRINDLMEEYWGKTLQPDIRVSELAKTYKAAMWSMLHYYCPITPSTYYLGTDGQMLGDAYNADPQQTIESRPIWSGGELIPVPAEWKNNRSQEYKEFERIFKSYKKQVLKPLFDEIDDCDNFIFCVDILNILMAGPELLLQNQREFKDFIEYLAPSKFGRWLDRIGNNPPRLAFVATKADMVTSGNKDNLKYLLKDFAESLVASGIKYKHFICAACISTKEMEDVYGQRKLIGRSCDNPQNEIEISIDLPEYWPDNWDGSKFSFPEVIPVISAMRPPEQVNLDNLFEFVIEGK